MKNGNQTEKLDGEGVEMSKSKKGSPRTLEEFRQYLIKIHDGMEKGDTSSAIYCLGCRECIEVGEISEHDGDFHLIVPESL